MRNEHVHTLRLMADMRDLVVHVCFFINDVALAVAVENTPLYTSGYVENYHSKLRKFAEVYQCNVSVNIKFDNKLAHRIYAGSDFFLMPSLYEPCGLGQLISLKYGTVPIVRKTGGLADTIQEFDTEAISGNGFLFKDYTSQALTDAVSRAYSIFCKREKFRILSEKCMEFNFSWEESAKKYKDLYGSILKSQ